MDNQSDCARKLKVLAGPARLAVMALLLDGPKYVSEINSALNLDQSLLSHHLQTLRREGLVDAEREGKAMRYRLAPGVGHASRQAIDLGCCLLSFDRDPR